LSDATAQARAEIWGGGVRPYAVPSKKLGMWLFIISDSLTFSVLLVTYSYVRLASTDWPTPFHGSSIALASVMTFCLLSSSLTMVMAVAAAHQDRRKQAVRWLFATIAGGLAFIVLHANEWLGLLHEGMRPFSNPWGSPLFGATFFTLTGLHMTHVAIGVIYLTIVALGFRAGRWSGTDVEVSGLYWHFVDLVWMFIFPLVYLMSAKI
jgi:cytochrome c oxidase subunit 3